MGKDKKDKKDKAAKKAEKAEKKALKTEAKSEKKDKKDKKEKKEKKLPKEISAVGGSSLLLVEQAEGLYLARFHGVDLLAMKTVDYEKLTSDPDNFRAVCKIEAIHNYISAEESLDVNRALTQGSTSKVLTKFLKSNAGKEAIKVIDKDLGKDLKEAGFTIDYSSQNLELHRGVRTHLLKLVKGLDKDRLRQAQVAMGHSISRKKMCEDPNRQDKPVTNSIALLDTIDKTVNLFAMRAREWYCWHFPELNKIVTDHKVFSKLINYIGDKDLFLKKYKADEETIKSELTDLCEGAEDVAEEIIAAALNSMGQEVTAVDMAMEQGLAGRVDQLFQTRKDLADYMSNKLDVVAPNLKQVVGDVLAARLIAHAGSVTNLAKAPASTIQILGAEKALFRALKTKGKTPKYGLLFSCSAISRANGKNKGRISRFVANKCAIASRFDAFSDYKADEPRSNTLGVKLAGQVEDRLVQLAEASAQ